MARPALIEDDELLSKLSQTFRETGYEAASVAALASAAGLQKASLYHRFPGGKEQMARDVLTAAEIWLTENVIAALKADGTPRQRLAGMADALNVFYSGGKLSCLLNVLSTDFGKVGPFTEQLRGLMQSLISAIAATLEDAGLESDEAQAKAEQRVSELQGSLIVSRVLETTAPFEQCLNRMKEVPCG
ncbi:Bacterial regulatory proteins, tetR family [Roseovarius litorisediminis]|uniref:Bacterial regulatory proteins, tetR family n=1 Tax=Roseovarius litorisediminis TaxID=1312363 RepID=A0A1Y5S028_9RHOB|nr:TetR/AcrR family transcriptional regulator [Roseovarius litorisediminis]SLN28938.1 Bacterial regulatory proteins, tetR family [Roseovarius litorisediminis]